MSWVDFAVFILKLAWEIVVVWLQRKAVKYADEVAYKKWITDYQAIAQEALTRMRWELREDNATTPDDAVDAELRRKGTIPTEETNHDV